MIVRDGMVQYTFGAPWPLWAHYAAAAIFCPPLVYGAMVLAFARAYGPPLVQEPR